MTYDLLVTNGIVVDGTGSPARHAAVGVRDGRIVAIGAPEGPARETVDAEGRVVAPGFIDIHTHYDAQILWDPMLTISPWHGVTTVVMGNCGFGVAPTRPGQRSLILRTLEKVEGMSLEALERGLGADWPFETFPQYLDAIARRGMAINVGVLVGHTPVRLYVMGEEATERAASDREVAAMRALVAEGIAAGALGFATSKSPTHVGYGGRPVPSRAATLDEILVLAGVLGDAGHGIVQVTAGPELFFSEFSAIARATGRRVTWTALLAGMMGPGSHRGFLDYTADLVRQGLPIVPQVACRPLNFEFQWKEPFVFESMPVFAPVSAADLPEKMRLYRDPAFRRAFKEAIAGSGSAFVPRWERTWIASCPSAPMLEERTVMEVARERGVDPLDLALDLGLASDLEARFRMAVLNDDEEEVAELLADPNTVIGLSDAGAHASQLCDACFATHLLGRWVRERGTFSLEEGVRMLTARPAEVLGITDRGRIAPGMAADMVVLDPSTVGAGRLRRVRDLPAGADRLVADATGIDTVIVNGCILRQAGRDRLHPGDTLPGRLLRGGETSSSG
jgi:N-acyl-D-aspartate/D-glutamate deacylase